MTPEDMANLHAGCFETPRPWNAGEFSELLQGNTVFLCERGAGFALGRAVAGEAELLTLAVKSDQRRRGNGTELLRAFEKAAEARSARNAFLEVSAENAGAMALYAANGYAESARRPNYYQAPDGRRLDAVVMTKSLASG